MCSSDLKGRPNAPALGSLSLTGLLLEGRVSGGRSGGTAEGLRIRHLTGQAQSIGGSVHNRPALTGTHNTQIDALAALCSNEEVWRRLGRRGLADLAAEGW